MKKTIDFDEIPDWQTFENLVAAYFRQVNEQSNSVNIAVKPSGEGADGGRDILVTFHLTDSIISFERKWVVQCKFYKKSVSKSKLSTVNIPTLIHEYKADGYLLVCKNDVTSSVSTMFENLERNCRMNYDYLFWNGSEFAARLNIIPYKPVIQTDFPEYYQFLLQSGGEKI